MEIFEDLSEASEDIKKSIIVYLSYLNELTSLNRESIEVKLEYSRKLSEYSDQNSGFMLNFPKLDINQEGSIEKIKQDSTLIKELSNSIKDIDHTIDTLMNKSSILLQNIYSKDFEFRKTIQLNQRELKNKVKDASGPLNLY